ncbi:MAG TPA: hypothetical protein DEF43_05780 [Chloroflexus aurantiacus]|nr:MAG: hypothetical protein D6716_02825 [Chloroflexota bacterium]HBW66669.1 hypothetical protein [Chloroflexus aurantiacus]
MCHALDREHGWRGSMAAALQTLRHVYARRVRHPIQRVIALAMVISPPRFHTGRLGAGYTIVGDWQAFMHLCSGRVARPYSFCEISARRRRSCLRLITRSYHLAWSMTDAEVWLLSFKHATRGWLGGKGYCWSST